MDETTPFGSFDLSGYLGATDRAEAVQMQPFSSAGMPWWESVAAYGLTRAIDNRLGPVNVAGNTNPGTFAGQNGYSYQQRPINQGGGSISPGSAGIDPMLLLVGAGLLLLLATS